MKLQMIGWMLLAATAPAIARPEAKAAEAEQAEMRREPRRDGAKPRENTGEKRPLITYFGKAGAPDPGPGKGEKMLVTFDNKSAAGVWERSKGEVIDDAGSIGGLRAAPAGNKTVYRSIGADSMSEFNFSKWAQAKPLSSLSFEWGSIDAYNFIDLLNPKGVTVWSLSGSDLPRFDGDWNEPMANQRLYLRFLPQANVSGIRMRSTGRAFEFDSIAAAAGDITAAVPEPGSWALMITGFGAIGHALRRRRATAAA